MWTFLAGILFVFVLFTGLVVWITLAGLKTSESAGGSKEISLFWGAITITDQVVNIFWDKIIIDGKTNKVRVAGIADIDGNSETVNVSNGDVLVDRKIGLIKIKKSLVLRVEAEEAILDGTKFDSALIAGITNLKSIKGSSEIKIEGSKVGEDDIYIHLQSDKSTSKEISS